MPQRTEHHNWSDYRRRSRLFWCALLLGPVIVLLVATEWLLERHGVHGLAWPLAAWSLTVLATGLHWQAFRCPRCNRRFFRRRPLLLALRASHCRQCMLPKD